ncbi:NAD kinase 2, mitochondrial-like [Symsagittifera roscoffensis]|uniref:NAD kinase 2, mitochondrial-like n=1 Tax=Symsagittifera roscoffensis TaxID=84072 RepID=UPI00307BD007
MTAFKCSARSHSYLKHARTVLPKRDSAANLICQRNSSNSGAVPGSKDGGVDLSKPLIVSKYTRLEFEQKRWGIRGSELKQFLQLQGSSYDNLIDKHKQHYSVLQKVEQTLKDLGADGTTVQREDYTEDLIANSSVIISVGGDGTFLQAASKITSRDKALIGVNSDKNKSLGILCLPSKFTDSCADGFKQLMQGKFKWLFRNRIRLTIDSNGSMPSAISLSDEQMKFYDHLSDLRNSSLIISSAYSVAQNHTHPSSQHATTDHKRSNRTTLPIRALNEVYIGEYVASGTSYFEMQVNQEPINKHKSSGLIVCTGTGSQAWFSSHRNLSTEQVSKVLKISSRYLKNIPQSEQLLTSLDEAQLTEISEAYLREFVHMDPCSSKMMFSVKDPLHNQVFRRPLGSLSHPFREQGVADTLNVHSRLWDGCVILDGNWAYGFDTGAWISLEILDEDALKTVQLID